MSFERLHTTVTYLLVSTGFLVLFLSGEMPALYWGLVVPAMVVSTRYEGHPRFSSVTLWNTVLVAALLIFGAAGILTGEWLHFAVYFTTMMVMAKLFQRHRARDVFQLYALSFLQLIAGAVINPTLTFAFCFVLYVVFLTWALVLLHLRRDLERLSELSDDEEQVRQATSGRMRRLVSPGFLAGTSMLALVLFAFSIMVFLFFPRLGLGFFGQHQQAGTDVSGFSDQIELGHFGKLKLDQTIVMRVELPGKVANRHLPLRLKGISFNQFDGVGWSKTPGNAMNDRVFEPLKFQVGDDYYSVPSPGPIPENGTELIQRIYLEQLNIGRRTVFAEPRMVGVKDLVNARYVANYRMHTRFYSDPDWDVVFSSRRSGALRYEVRSIKAPKDAAVLDNANGAYTDYMLQYTELPVINPQVNALAKTITKGRRTRYSKAIALEAYLQKEYEYSLEGGHNTDDPLSDFLFGRKSGHCEYFSTAFVVMARTLGLAARPVGGFYGGVYNEAGNYVQIRQADAHSWAEIYFPGQGWVTFDPTPADRVLVEGQKGIWAQIKLRWDSLELLWYKWVIRWDMERQIEFIKSIGKQIPGLTDMLPKSRSGARKKWYAFKERVKELFPYIAAAVVIFFLLIWFLRRYLANRRRGFRARAAKPGNGPDARQARKMYNAILRAAVKRGVEVRPSSTPGRVLESIASVNADAARDAAPVISLYQDVVFGGVALDKQREAACREHLRKFKKSA